MIAPLEGAEGAMGVVVYGNQGKGGMGSPSDTPLAPYFRAGLVLFTTRFGLRSGVTGIRRRAISTTLPRVWVWVRRFVPCANSLPW
jgi:hypothetical protein